MKRRSRFSPTDRQLWLLIGAAVFILAILLWVVMKPSPEPPLQELNLACELAPEWGENPVAQPAATLDAEPEVLKVYLDVSYPMGGFLPFPSDDSFSGYRAVVQLVPDHMIREFGETTDLAIRWMGVAENLRELRAVPRINRGLFNGRETRLHLAITDILNDLTSGKAEAAALITDLLATEELTGAMGAAKPLDDWLGSAEVRSGVFDLGLLGVRASYWGVTHPTACPRPLISDVGCWYSERRPGYKRLTGVVNVPFYVLLLGRGGGPISAIGEAIRADAENLGLDAHWELLTKPSQPITTTLNCKAHKPGTDPTTPQYALFREKTGHFRCARDEQVALTCDFPEATDIVPQTVTSSWEAVKPRVDGERIAAIIDCGSLRQPHLPENDLRLTIKAQVRATGNDVWDEWTKETDELEKDLGRTLQLKYFVEKLRLAPDQYSAELESILRTEANGP